MAVVKDWRGTTIKVGSTVVYPSRQGSSLWMSEGKVVSVETDISLARPTERGRKNFARVGVRKKGSTKASTRISYPDAERVTVIT